jgi:hypothetical protein
MSETDEQQILQMEAECSILEKIAEQFATRSPEELAIRRAAFALIFAVLHHEEEFSAYLSTFERVPTPEELKKIDETFPEDAEPPEIK